VIARYKHTCLFGLVVNNEGKNFITLRPAQVLVSFHCLKKQVRSYKLDRFGNQYVFCSAAKDVNLLSIDSLTVTEGKSEGEG
jgi:hypothetical protein